MLKAIDILKNYGLKDELMHFGVGPDDNPPGRGSGRYEQGSGERPFQHVGDFSQRVKEYRKLGYDDKEIVKIMHCKSTDELRRKYTKDRAVYQNARIEEVARLHEQGLSGREIGRKLGIPEATVRSLLKPESKEKVDAILGISKFLKEQVDEKGVIDVGKGTEKYLGISGTRLKSALSDLEDEGYELYEVRRPQVTNPSQKTTYLYLCPPGTDRDTLYDDNFKSEFIGNWISYDGGKTFDVGFHYPESLDSSRLAIRYAEDGGINQDGLIMLRRGVPDLDLQGANYSQVRIMVDGTHYLKGMAVYSDDLPPGIDVLFNTNKHEGTPALGEGKESVLKKIKDDPKNPFGSLIKDEEHGGQYYYIDENGERKLGLINKRADAGDWDKWAQTLPSQFLSKQPEKLIKSQLGIAEADRRLELDKIMAITNDTVKRKLLEDYADDCDSAAEHLKAAALPRQRYQVILPLTTIGDNEVYAPNYTDGETVALIRYPHGGTFEIPILKVNNKNAEGINMLGPDAPDAVGINAHVAARLSGADFDGDTVQVIPCNSSSSKVRIMSTPPLKELEGFDPKDAYPEVKGMTYMTKKDTQKKMGEISNLITDMTLKGATEDKIARAVKHSMVVIDAEKHKLNYTKSYEDNDIEALKQEFQKQPDGKNKKGYGGASTLLSRAKSEERVPLRNWKTEVDPETGEVIYKIESDSKRFYESRTKVRAKDPVTGKYLKDDSGNYIYETYTTDKGKTRIKTEPSGKIIERQTKSTQMAETKDARTLSSGTRPEEIYADYANSLKSMANEARKEWYKLDNNKPKVSRAAQKEYEKEVKSLDNKLNEALKNAPRERAAQELANIEVKYRLDAIDGEPTSGEKKKIRQQAITNARLVTGAHRQTIDITDKEWEAIQAHAVSDTKLTDILRYADGDRVRQLATPREAPRVTLAQINLIQRLKSSGYTNEQIAERAGVSVSTVINQLSQANN